MSQQDHLTPAEEELAAALGALAPARPTIDRDRMLYLSGRAAGRRTARLWQGTSAALAACLLIAVAVPAWGPTGPDADMAGPRDRSAEVPSARVGLTDVAPAFAAAGPFDGSYVRLRNDVLARGIEALPPMADSSPAWEPSASDATLAVAARPRLRGAGLAAILSFLHRRENP